jgi:hypothetical protein
MGRSISVRCGGAAELFRDNFKTYEAGVGADITAAGPHERAASIAI